MEDVSNCLEEIKDICRSLQSLYAAAYDLNKPEVDEMCARAAAEKEVENLLEKLLAFCEDEAHVMLYRRVCRRFYKDYPEMITEYVQLYFHLYCDDDFKTE